MFILTGDSPRSVLLPQGALLGLLQPLQVWLVMPPSFLSVATTACGYWLSHPVRWILGAVCGTVWQSGALLWEPCHERPPWCFNFCSWNLGDERDLQMLSRALCCAWFFPVLVTLCVRGAWSSCGCPPEVRSVISPGHLTGAVRVQGKRVVRIPSGTMKLVTGTCSEQFASQSVLFEPRESGLLAGLLASTCLLMVVHGKVCAPVINDGEAEVLLYPWTSFGVFNAAQVVSLPAGVTEMGSTMATVSS